MAAVCLCDLHARIIPWEPCAALLVLGLLFSASVGNGASIPPSLLLAAVLLAVSTTGNLLSEHLHDGPAIGSGDLRLIPALCLFGGVEGSFLGMFACALSMACLAMCALISGSVTRSSHLPLAPGLAIWYATGALSHGSSLLPLQTLNLM